MGFAHQQTPLLHAIRLYQNLFAFPDMVSKASTQTPFHIPSLDGMRAAAILIVFLSHAGLSHVAPRLFGVTIFFLPSGYLITTLLQMECERDGSASLRHFFCTHSTHYSAV